jgi:lysophospholipase L1-like esterase
MVLRKLWLQVGCSALMWINGCNKHDTTTKSPLVESPRTVATTPSALTQAVVARSDARLTDASTVGTASATTLDAGGNTQPPIPEQIAQECRILAVGDSLTDPRSGGGGYLKAWAQKCPQCQFTNLGRGGAMVNQMLWRLRQYFDENPSSYTHVVVFGGVNDLYSDQTAHRSLERIERDLSGIYQLARSHARSVVAITVAPWGGFRRWYTDDRGRHTGELNQWIAQGRARGDVDVVVASETVLTCGDPARLCPAVMPPFRDGLHFGIEGHRKLGEALLMALGERACAVPNPALSAITQ